MRRIRALLLACAVAGLAVQRAAAADVFSVLSFDNGYAPAFNLTTGNVAVASRFAVNVQLSEAMSAGFVFLDGDNTVVPDYRFLRLNYGLLDRVRLNVSLGTVTGASTAPAVAVGSLTSGIGFDVVVFKRKFQDVLASEFKVQADYIFTPAVAGTGVLGGILFVGFAVGIGI